MLIRTISIPRAGTVLVALAATLTIAACGSSSATSVASVGSATARATARVNLAKCLRSHGINVPDSAAAPGTSTTGGPGPGGGGILRNLFRQYTRTEILSAMQACRQYVRAAFPNAALTPAQRAQRLQQLVKFAECLRSHGINVPDPTAGGTGFGLGAGFGQALRSQAGSPAFQTAVQDCQYLRPRFRRRFTGT